MSRFEFSKKHQIEIEEDSLRKALIDLELARYYARRGEFTKCKEIISKIRESYKNNYFASLFSALNLTEGILDFVEQGVGAALPKLQRARALSVGARDADELPVLIFAWLANFARIQTDWGRLHEYLISCLTLVQSHFHETLARISIVIADSLQEIEEYDSAAKWYMVARDASLSVGDDATMNAMLHNRISIRVYNFRIAAIDGNLVDFGSRLAKLETESTENYSLYIGDSSMPWTHALISGQLSLLSNSNQAALQLLESPYAKGLSDKWPSVELMRAADVLRCKVELGLISSELVKCEVDRIRKNFSSRIARGDVAIAANSVAIAFGKFDKLEAKHFSEISQSALGEYYVEREIVRHHICDALSFLPKWLMVKI